MPHAKPQVTIDLDEYNELLLNNSQKQAKRWKDIIQIHEVMLLRCFNNTDKLKEDAEQIGNYFNCKVKINKPERENGYYLEIKFND